MYAKVFNANNKNFQSYIKHIKIILDQKIQTVKLLISKFLVLAYVFLNDIHTFW
jgi:hypothetical protein